METRGTCLSWEVHRSNCSHLLMHVEDKGVCKRQDSSLQEMLKICYGLKSQLAGHGQWA